MPRGRDGERRDAEGTRRRWGETARRRGGVRARGSEGVSNLIGRVKLEKIAASPFSERGRKLKKLRRTRWGDGEIVDRPEGSREHSPGFSLGRLPPTMTAL